jgi:hypothetical protein
MTCTHRGKKILEGLMAMSLFKMLTLLLLRLALCLRLVVAVRQELGGLLPALELLACKGGKIVLSEQESGSKCNRIQLHKILRCAIPFRRLLGASMPTSCIPVGAMKVLVALPLVVCSSTLPPAAFQRSISAADTIVNALKAEYAWLLVVGGYDS